MNQRIAVRALVKKDEKVLLLRRATGRESIRGKYELPGGRVEHVEQPEDALLRLLKDTTGLTPQTAQLSDVLTYIDHDNRDIQYAVIFYQVSVASSPGGIALDSNYDHYAWRKPGLAVHEDLTELSQILLSTMSVRSVPEPPEDSNSEPLAVSPGKTIVYSDGGSRGNPGPSAAGYVVMGSDGILIDEGGIYLGVTTNNQAEYQGVYLGLEKAKSLGAVTVEARIDSLLVVNQLNGAYVIRNRELWPIHERIRALVAEFEKVTFRHVRRELNQRADAMVNKILDDHTKGKV